jgi:hypothetical protein
LKFANSARGSVSTMKAVKAVILINTSTALKRALSLVPIISSQVTSIAITSAGRLTRPPGAPPSASGPALSAGGRYIPKNSRNIVPLK